MGDSDDESSNYTGSQVSEREDEFLSEDNTVQQNGSMIMMPIQGEDELESSSFNVAIKSNKVSNIGFTLNKFNSVAPIDSIE